MEELQGLGVLGPSKLCDLGQVPGLGLVLVPLRLGESSETIFEVGFYKLYRRGVSELCLAGSIWVEPLTHPESIQHLQVGVWKNKGSIWSLLLVSQNRHGKG